MENEGAGVDDADALVKTFFFFFYSANALFYCKL